MLKTWGYPLQPDQSFSYTTELPEASGNLIGLGLPPTTTTGSAVITVTWLGSESPVYTIGNDIYWNAVLDAADRYAVEPTFTIQKLHIFLPLVVRSG